MSDNFVVFSASDLGFLAPYAVHYAMGRQTYMPSLIRDILRPHLSGMPEHTIDIMLDDCKRQAERGNWGSESIDKPGWISWRLELLEEKKREHGDVNTLPDIALAETDAGTVIICASRDMTEAGYDERTIKSLSACMEKYLSQLCLRDLHVLARDVEYHDGFFKRMNERSGTQDVLDAWNAFAETAFVNAGGKLSEIRDV